MSKQLLAYFTRERSRLLKALASARRLNNRREITCLEQLLEITEHQLSCWIAELVASSPTLSQKVAA